MKLNKKYLILALVVAILLAAVGVTFYLNQQVPRVVLGYFHGGRTMVMYRTKYFDYFDNEKVQVDLLTKHLRQGDWFVLPKVIKEAELSEKDDFGKATGTELVELITMGKVDGATIGEAAFLRAVQEKKPIMAVAELGYDLTERPGHGIVIRKNIKIKKPADLEKLTWGARRSSGGDEMYLRDFLKKEGVDLNKVKIVSNVNDDLLLGLLMKNKIQGAYFHLTTIRAMLKKKAGYVYRKMDWIDAQTSQALLVFHKSYLAKNENAVQRLVSAYMKRVAYENALPLDVRRLPNREHAFELATDIQGMDFPHFRNIPSIRPKLLEDMQNMLLENKFLTEKSDFRPYIDQRFVKSATQQLYPDNAWTEPE